MAMIKDLQVQCEKDMMRVRIQFDRPFYGMVFSKGHYSNINCVHVPSGLGQTQVYLNFDLLKKCDHGHVFKKKIVTMVTRLHFEFKNAKYGHFDEFLKTSKLAVKKCYQTGQF